MTFPAFTVKPKTCAYEKCGREFIPRRPLQNVCGPVCAGRWSKAKTEEKAKAERARVKERKRALETPRTLLPKAQKEVNRWCRLIDLLEGRGCISCGATYRTAFGGVFDAGHFRSVGSAGHLRFYTPQIHLQCVKCNRDLSGNTVEFRKGLVALRGVADVERIEAMYWIAKWDVDYLRRLTSVAKKRADRLEKRLKEKA
jgi:hypothetical protein